MTTPPINPIISDFLSIFKQDKHLIVRKIREIVTGIIFEFKKRLCINNENASLSLVQIYHRLNTKTPLPVITEKGYLSLLT